MTISWDLRLINITCKRLQIKDLNALIDNKPFFAQPVNNKQKAYEKLIKIPRNNNYAAGNLLDFSYHQSYYKCIGINLSRPTNTKIPRQISFTGKLEKDDSATMFFIRKATKNYSKHGKVKHELRAANYELYIKVRSSNSRVKSLNLWVTNSNAGIMSSNPQVRRPKAWVARLKTQKPDWRLKTQDEAIKPWVK